MPEGTLEARPKLAGSYWDWQHEGTRPLVSSIGSTVAVAGTHDWGPVNLVGLYTSFEDFRADFGATWTDFSRAVYGAFKGEGWGGRGGASGVLVRRQSTAAADEATLVLDNTAAADALGITAKHPGTRGNAFRVAVQAGTEAGTKEVLIYDGAQVVERYTHDQTDLAALATDINDISDRVSATVLLDGTALVNLAATNLAAGNDGAVLTGTEWTATFDAYDFERWSIFAPANLTDATLRASLVSWIQARNTLGRRCLLVLGGAIDESRSTADARSEAINDYDVVNLGVGRLRLNDLSDVEVSTAQFAGRYAGSIAFRGEKSDTIFVRFADVEIVSGPSLADLELAYDSGTTVFTRDTDVNAPVHVRDGVTTYSDDSDSTLDDEGFKTKPVVWYRSVKNVRIQHAIELEVDEWATSGNILGELPNNDRVRSIIKGHFEELYQAREEAEIVQPGWAVVIVPGDPDDDFVQIKHGFHPTRSLRQMFNVARVG